MNKDVLHSHPLSNDNYNDSNSTSSARTTLDDLVYREPRYRGEVGWICPVCGRGNAPSTAYCNCNMREPNIVYANGGTTITSVLDRAINCNSTPPEAYYTTTATTATNERHEGAVYGAHYDKHN